MMQSAITAEALRPLILDDVLGERDHSRRLTRSLLRTVLWWPALRFASMAADFDETVAQLGFRESVCRVIPNFARDTQRRGCEHIPDSGPLLIASNHPGSCDSLLLAASLPRDDLKIIASGASLLRGLPNASEHLIFLKTPGKSPTNFSVVRAAIRHLRSGGALLIFPSGRIDPDPTVLSGAAEALKGWSKSIELFLRSVPQTMVQISIVGGVMLPAFAHNPLIAQWKGPRNSAAVAGIVQTIVQMLLPGWVRPRPTISFGRPRTSEQLRRGSQSLHQSLIAEAERLLEDHCNGRSEKLGSQPVEGSAPSIRFADN